MPCFVDEHVLKKKLSILVGVQILKRGAKKGLSEVVTKPISLFHRLDDDFEDGNNVDSDWDPTSHNPTAVKFKDVEDDDELDREVSRSRVVVREIKLTLDACLIWECFHPI